jgi:hypothetical protein
LLIALLAILGVNLLAIAVVLAIVLSRKRWVMRQPGAFRGAIRVADGEIDGLHAKWGRGYGRWVSNVLVWTKAPFLFRNEVLRTDGLEQGPSGRPLAVKRLGEQPVVVRVKMGVATAEVAARDDDRERVLGPYRESG